MKNPVTPRILAFSSPGCAPCRAMKPVLERLSAQYGDGVEVVHIDTWADPDAAARYHVTSVPTLLGVVGESVVAQQIGYAGEARVEAFFQQLA